VRLSFSKKLICPANPGGMKAAGTGFTPAQEDGKLRRKRGKKRAILGKEEERKPS